jgi:Tol biopolymer transport system component
MNSLESLVNSTKTLLKVSMLVGTISLTYLMTSCGRQEKHMSINPSKIVFNSDVSGNGDNDLYIMDSDGKNRKRLTDNPNFDAFSSLSKYGKIAFTSGRDKNPGIYVMDLDGKNVQRLSSDFNIDVMPSWSPDGEKIAFYSLRDGNTEIYVMNADGSKQTRLTSSSGDDVRPSWSPDGTRIFFDSDREGNAEIYVMNADGSEQRRLTKNPAVDIDPSCSVNGTIAFSSNREGLHQIYVMDLSGNNIRKLTSGSSINAYPVWSEDGSKLFFASTRNGKAQIYSMNADGSEQKRVNSSNFDDCDPSFSVLESYQQNDGADNNQTKKNNLDASKAGKKASIDEAIGYFQEAEINCIMRFPDSKLAAIYTLKTKNTMGKTLHNANAELYLLDERLNSCEVSTYKIGNVSANSDIEAIWKIESSSQIGEAWQSRQKSYVTAHDRMWYVGKPDMLIFIKSREGVFEVNSKKFNLCYPVGGDKFEVTAIEVMSDYNHSVFENAGIKLPKK